MLELPADAADLAEVAEMYMGLGVNYTGSGGMACDDGRYLHMEAHIDATAQFNFTVARPSHAQQAGVEIKISPDAVMSAQEYVYTP